MDPSAIVDRTIQRLRALAEGNGIDPHSIKLIGSDEQSYTLEATMHFTPLCDVENKRYPGPARSKGALVLQDAAALQAEVGRRREEFRQHTDWIAEVKAELQSAPGHGWGLDGAKVMLPKRNAILAASTPCQQCNGTRTITCSQCQGSGSTVCFQCRGDCKELCYNCQGSGQNPQQPTQQCLICRGNRYIVCRQCLGTGQIPCPTCGGKRGTPCPACRGTGQITEEAQLTFGATTRFELKSSALPSGLRRGLDRLGIPNLAKGHAVIDIVTPKKEGDDHPQEDGPPPRPQPPDPSLHYQAQLPFAELRVDFNGKKAVVSIFGKRNMLIDVPPFLDEALNPWRMKLLDAAKGNLPIGDALKVRAMRDALGLELQGKGNAQELRRLYPAGLTLKTAEEIARGMRLAIKRTTLHVRTAAAVGCAMLGAGLFGECYFTSLPERIPFQPRWFGLAFDFLPPVLAIGLAWVSMNAIMGFFLKRTFPDMTIGRRLPIGKTGYMMSAAIVIFWLIILILSPARPSWLSFHH